MHEQYFLDIATTFSALIDIIGVNPFVFLPDAILQTIFKEAGKAKSPIQVKGFINDKPFTQNLMYYKGAWRLYINTAMLKDSPKRIGEMVTVMVVYDPIERTIPMHSKLQIALEHNTKAKAIFDILSPSLQKEILRYIHHLKSKESIDRNVAKAIQFLLGEAKFIGRPPIQLLNILSAGSAVASQLSSAISASNSPVSQPQ